MKVPSVAFITMILAAGWASAAAAQSASHRFELGVQVAAPRSGTFEKIDIGVGGRVSWHPASVLGLEAELDLFPAEFPADRAFSRSRLEGLFGATVGPTLGRLRPFAKIRAGFLDFREAPRPLACILIYPPPLSCVLAAGSRVAAFDLGGGVELFTSPRTFVRVDAGDRLVKYPGPAFDPQRRTAHTGSFFGHDIRLAFGGGLRL